MRLKHLELENFCQHKKFAQDFHRGITGIFGPNGSGKSNLLAAIKVNLCNDYGTNNGTKALAVSRGLGRRERSFVRAVWEHDGQEFEVVRGLKPAEHSLRIGSAAPIVGDALVQDALNQILKAPLDTVGKYLFVDQWRMFSFVEQQDAARLKAFAQLCGAGEAEKIWTALGKELDALATETTLDVRSACAELGRQVSELHATLAQLEKRLQKPVPGRLTEEIRTSHNSRIAVFEQRIKLLQELNTMANDALKLAEEHKSAAERLRSAEESFAAHDAEISRLQVEVSRLGTDNLRYTQRQRLVQKLEQANNAKAQHANVVSKLAKQEPPKHEETLEELRNERAVLLGRKTQLEQAITMFTGDENCCPLCSSAVEDPAALVLTLRGALNEVVEQLADVGARQDARRAEDEAWQDVQNRLRSAQDGVRAQLITITQTADALQAYEDVANWSPARFMQLQQELRDAQTGAEQLQIQKVRERHMQLAARSELLQQQIDASQEQLSKLPAPDRERNIERLRLELREDVEAGKVMQQQQAEAAATRRLLDSTMLRLQHLEQQQQQGEARETWRQDVSALRELFHRNNLPSLLMNRMFSHVVNEMNNWLELFGKPFSVCADEGLSLVALRPNGDRETALRLSGGQKVMLAMTYWPAINSLFAGSIGFLSLDEPTAGLDNDRIDCLRELMGELRSSAKRHDQQILLVTHDERLEPALDNVIHLQRS